MTKRYDIIIIGGGNAGFGVSAAAHEAGKSIAFVESRDFGGTCPNRGCTPKKFLVAAAHTMHEIERAGVHGIEVGAAKLDWKKLIQREKSMIAGIPDGMASLADKRGDVYRGEGRFVGPNTVSVDGQILEAENIVIATGSTPRPLSIEGAEHLITSDEVLSEETQPDEVVFIGGGVIAMEFSHVYARAGTKVTILEAMPRFLPQMDEDAVAAIRRESKRLGIHVETSVDIKKVERADSRLTVVYEVDGVERQVEADRVVNGAGRIANVAQLDLDAGNVKHDRTAIEVDEYLRSVSNPSVWVVGDALVGSPQLSPVATYEGQLVGKNIVFGPTHKPDYSVIPSGIYTVPALSSVGLTEQSAKDKGLNVRVTQSDMTGWFSGKTYAETTAYAKVIIDENDDSIVGAHMVGHSGEELIHIFAMAMKHGIKANDLKNDFYAFPTFSSDLKSMF
jgi:glutathione reductase (NADPH)